MFGTALLLIFPVLMVCAAAMDLTTMTIPNKLSIALAGAFALFVAAGGLSWSHAAMHLAAGVIVLAVGFGLFAAGWIGGGDAKLAAVTALWLGFDLLPDYLILSSMAGGVLTLAILAIRRVDFVPAFALEWDWLRRLREPQSGVPYGIALAGAALAVYPEADVWTAVGGW
jgi:prepilin peptidase CpaA